MADCVVEKLNMGLTQCNKLPGLLRGMITTPEDFQIDAADTTDAAAVMTALQAALLDDYADRSYLWPPFVGFENISEEAVYEETPLAYLAVRDGNYRFRFSVKENLCIHKAMYSHRASQGRAFLIDDQNQLIGMKDADGNFKGFSIQLLNTEKMMFSDGSVSTKSPVVLALRNNKELDKSGAIITLDDIDSLDRITDAVLTVVGTPNSTTIVVDVTVECDGTKVNGLVVADFVKKTTAGATQTISSIAEVDGRYTLTGTGFTTGTVGLTPAATISIPAYEADPVAVTIA